MSKLIFRIRPAHMGRPDFLFTTVVQVDFRVQVVLKPLSTLGLILWPLSLFAVLKGLDHSDVSSLWYFYSCFSRGFSGHSLKNSCQLHRHNEVYALNYLIHIREESLPHFFNSKMSVLLCKRIIQPYRKNSSDLS